MAMKLSLNALLPVVALLVAGYFIFTAIQGMRKNGGSTMASSPTVRGPTVAEADVFPTYMSNKRTINRLNRTAPIREGLNDRPAYGKRLGNPQDPRQDHDTFGAAIAQRLAKQLQSADQELLFERSEDMVSALEPNSSLSIR